MLLGRIRRYSVLIAHQRFNEGSFKKQYECVRLVAHACMWLHLRELSSNTIHGLLFHKPATLSEVALAAD